MCPIRGFKYILDDFFDKYSKHQWHPSPYYDLKYWRYYQDNFKIYLDEYEEPEQIPRGCPRTVFTIGT